MMTARDKILNAVKANQPAFNALSPIGEFAPYFDNAVAKFSEVLEGIGAGLHFVSSYDEIIQMLNDQFAEGLKFVTTIPQLSAFARLQPTYATPHELADTELAVISAQFGVAENGAVWITEDELPERAFPFIPQHLAVVLPAGALVGTMHDAYNKIGNTSYGWASFIAGPSKTADIEQSLVLGAHGPRTMTIFILDSAEADDK